APSPASQGRKAVALRSDEACPTCRPHRCPVGLLTPLIPEPKRRKEGRRTLLRHPHCSLFFGRAHLVPHGLQIPFDPNIVGILAECECKPTIGVGKIARYAVSRRIHRTQQRSGFRIRSVCCRAQSAEGAAAVLSHTSSV